MEYFKTIFNITDWDLLTQALLGNDSHNMFSRSFIKVYDQALPKRNQSKTEELVELMDFKRLKKIVKKPPQKQCLHEKLLKQRCCKNSKLLKLYKNLFEK